ncbi:MAG TPA: TatD family hydrolase [Acidimicrobiales bacterium]|nr:TatD family hydrolase [Acidimicrobiales bacterium]
MTDEDTQRQRPSGGWTDSHCHLQSRFAATDERDDVELRAVLERAAAAGVARAVCVGTDEVSSLEAVRIANLDGLPVEVLATVGLHPHDASRGTGSLGGVLDAEGADRVVAIGECGLDYYYEHSSRDAQRAALRDQLALAKDRDLAVVLHVRDAFDDLFEILDDVGVPERTILHCFSGGPEEARRCVAAGMFVSISGIVTFKNAEPIRAALGEVPLARLLVETDSPFLAPEPHRGRPNEPALVPLVGERVASTLNLDLSVVRDATSVNASRVFGGLDPV